jgi:uncharacterized protein (TIGR04141 family)
MPSAGCVWKRADGLFERLARHLAGQISHPSPETQLWMAADGIIDWNQVSYFQFGGSRSARRFSTLSLDRLIEHAAKGEDCLRIV